MNCTSKLSTIGGGFVGETDLAEKENLKRKPAHSCFFEPSGGFRVSCGTIADRTSNKNAVLRFYTSYTQARRPSLTKRRIANGFRND